MLTPEQVLAAQKANLETLFGLTNKAIEGVERLVELNVTASKTVLAEAAAHTQSSLNVKDVQELLTLQASMLQPLGEKATSYSRQLYDIISSASNELGKSFESKASESIKTFAGLVDTAAKNAPAGSEAAVAVAKSAVAAAGSAYESVQSALKQATQLVENNVQAVAATALNASKASPAKKAR